MSWTQNTARNGEEKLRNVHAPPKIIFGSNATLHLAEGVRATVSFLINGSESRYLRFDQNTGTNALLFHTVFVTGSPFISRGRGSPGS